MRGRLKQKQPKSVEELLPEVWEVVAELKRLTDGLEQSLAATIAKKGEPDGSHD